MTPSARLQAIIDILEQVETQSGPADSLVSFYFRSRRYIGSKDRVSISDGVYALFRHHARLNWWLEKTAAENTPRTRLLAYLSLSQHMDADTISDLCNGGKYAPACLSDDEKKWLAQFKGQELRHKEMSAAVWGECPEWAAASLQKHFGENFEAEMDAQKEPALVNLRINSLKISRDEALAQLRANDIKAERCALSPLGIQLKGRVALGNLELLKQGEIEVQDEGSQLVALLLNPQPGEHVVDFCAGAGGKTLALGAAMKNRGRVTACDVLVDSLKNGTERFRRAGLNNIETKLLENERDPWVKEHEGSFHRVLVDAPCSGSGVWRRNPTSRWYILGPTLQELLPLQASILASASSLVKEGGTLVYATCSLLPEENEMQIEAFLKTHPHFKCIDAHKNLSFLPAQESPYLALTPRTHKTDGFFAALLQRDAAL